MTRDLNGRLVISCDRCPIRMDLGPAEGARRRNRMPSGWVSAGSDRHYCPNCTATVGLAALAAGHDGGQQPLSAQRSRP